VKVSVVLPVYNEASRIRESVEEIEDFLEKTPYEFEIIIAEDGSTDGTDNIASELSLNKKIIHMHSDKRLGRGRALKNAFLGAEGDILIYMDADLATDLSSTRAMIEGIENGFDICIGSRYLESSKAERSFLRKTISLTYNLLVKLLFNTELKDMQCGLKAFDKKTLPTILNVRDDYWFWDTEALLTAEKQKKRIKEIPVVWKEKKSSKVKIFRDSIYMGIKLIKLRVIL
jgi:glycosyltransferase involved in cell wall biosynthesis